MSGTEYPTGTFSPVVASIEFVDVSGDPIENLHYKLTLPDGTEKEDTTGKDGIVSIPAGAEGEIEIDILQEESGEDSSKDQDSQ